MATAATIVGFDRLVGVVTPSAASAYHMRSW
jgi:hypothetical protein